MHVDTASQHSAGKGGNTLCQRGHGRGLRPRDFNQLCLSLKDMCLLITSTVPSQGVQCTLTGGCWHSMKALLPESCEFQTIPQRKKGKQPQDKIFPRKPHSKRLHLLPTISLVNSTDAPAAKAESTAAVPVNNKECFPKQSVKLPIGESSKTWNVGEPGSMC